MSPRALASASLALCSLFACSNLIACNSSASTAQAVPVAATPPAPTPAPAEPAAKTDDATVSLMPARNSPRPAPEPPLTQEELDLLAADPATLTPELRRKRGFAMRRKILQNPDSPTARQLEALRIAAERGEITPQLPDRSGDSGLVLHARTPEPAAPEATAPAPGAKTPATPTP